MAFVQYVQIATPLFVTWKIRLPDKDSAEDGHDSHPAKKEDDEDKEMLRGCIGTFAKESLKANLPLYSLISAFKDTRFPPISLREIPFLKCTVSLLQNFESIKDPYDWIVGKHGTQVKFKAKGQPYSATFLPEVASEQGWDQKQTINQLLRKAGYKGTLESVKDGLNAERYQSTMHTASFLDYIDFTTKNKGLFKLSAKSVREGMEEDEDDMDGENEEKEDEKEAKKGGKK